MKARLCAYTGWTEEPRVSQLWRRMHETRDDDVMLPTVPARYYIKIVSCVRNLSLSTIQCTQMP